MVSPDCLVSGEMLEIADWVPDDILPPLLQLRLRLRAVTQVRSQESSHPGLSLVRCHHPSPLMGCTVKNPWDWESKIPTFAKLPSMPRIIWDLRVLRIWALPLIICFYILSRCQWLPHGWGWNDVMQTFSVMMFVSILRNLKECHHPDFWQW